MAPTPLVSIGLLATGALAGAGLAAVFSRPRSEDVVLEKQQQATPTRPTGPTATASLIPAMDTDLVDRRLMAMATRQAGGAIECSGYPGPISDFLVNTAYISGYDRRLRHPAWTAHHMTAESLLKLPLPPGSPPPPRADRSNSVFKEDDRVPEAFRARLADYFRSGYDRGHMVAAADAKYSQKAMDETFYLSNIAPQVGEGFNRDYWAHTEDFLRRLTGQFADVYVFTVPLYLAKQDLDGKWRVSYEVIGNPPAIGVPTHFAKVVLGAGRPTPTRSAPLPLPGPIGQPNNAPALTPRGLAGNLVGEKWVGLTAFVIPNARVPNDVPLKDFVVPVESVERAAGLTLFPAPIKSTAKQLCSLVDCSLIVRDFSNANRNVQKNGGMQRSNSAPAGLTSR